MVGLMPCLGWLPVVPFRATRKDITPDAVRELLRLHLVKQAEWPSSAGATVSHGPCSSSSRQTPHAFLGRWFIQREESGANAYDAHWRHCARGVEKKIMIAELEKLFLHAGFEDSFEQIRKNGSRLSVVRNTAQYDDGNFVIK